MLVLLLLYFSVGNNNATDQSIALHNHDVMDGLNRGHSILGSSFVSCDISICRKTHTFLTMGSRNRLWLLAACLLVFMGLQSIVGPNHGRKLAVVEWSPKGMGLYERTGKIELHPFSEQPFRLQQCNRAGVEGTPSGVNLWQRNVPYVVIAGAAKSGTTTLATLIRQHPRVLRPEVKELKYFQNLPIEDNNTIIVKKARESMYAWGGYPIEKLRRNVTLVSFDATPSYLYRSAFIFPQILCVCPWVKIIVILRDPVERMFSSYRYQLQRGLTNQTFEQVVDAEFRVLDVAGLRHPLDPGSAEEWVAWNKYHALSVQGGIGKGLYEIQLRHLIRTMRTFRKDIRRDLMILDMEELKHDLGGTLRKMVRFLKLEPFETPEVFYKNEGEVNQQMQTETRERLETFYRPYKHRLRQFLGETWNEFSSSTVTSRWR